MSSRQHHDLSRWEAGELATLNLLARHPGPEIVSLVAMHDRLTCATEDITVPPPDWERLAARLPERDDEIGARRSARRWTVGVLVAATLVLGSAVAYATGPEIVRRSIHAIVHDLRRFFAGGDQPELTHTGLVQPSDGASLTPIRSADDTSAPAADPNAAVSSRPETSGGQAGAGEDETADHTNPPTSGGSPLDPGLEESPPSTVDDDPAQDGSGVNQGDLDEPEDDDQEEDDDDGESDEADDGSDGGDDELENEDGESDSEAPDDDSNVEESEQDDDSESEGSSTSDDDSRSNEDEDD